MTTQATIRDETFMRECFRLAQKGEGHVSPNPLVGAVLVVRGEVVSRGYHRKYGAAHAEVYCLQHYNGSLSAAVLYVNMEPCSHYGKTPPCTDLIIQKGIKKVVIAMRDPNPLVSGRGIRRLRQAGIAVVVGILENEARQLNRFFVNHIRTGLPYVHLKITQTSDGFIARNRRKLQYITSYPSRRLVHKWRSAHDAVLVGAGTIKADDPRLDVRLVKGRNPAVVILDGKLSVKGSERVFSSADGRNVFLCTCRSAIESHRKTSESLQKKGVIVLQFSENKKKLDLHQILKRLYTHNIGSVLVEGGSIVFTEFLLKGCVDELSVFVSPQEYGRGVPAFSDGGKSLKSLQNLVSRGHLSTSFVGDDLLLSGTFR